MPAVEKHLIFQAEKANFEAPISGTDLSCDPDLNSDADGDSDGTTTQTTKPGAAAIAAVLFDFDWLAKEQMKAKRMNVANQPGVKPIAAQTR